MRRRFVIGVETLDSSQETELRNFLKSKGAWWHWIANLWLFTTKNQSIKAEEIRDFIVRLKADARVVVVEFPEDIDWATSNSVNSDGKKIFTWLTSPWGDEDN